MKSFKTEAEAQAFAAPLRLRSRKTRYDVVMGPTRLYFIAMIRGGKCVGFVL